MHEPTLSEIVAELHFSARGRTEFAEAAQRLADKRSRGRIANLLRQGASYGRRGLSAAQVEAMCAEADALDPLTEGPWRP